MSTPERKLPGWVLPLGLVVLVGGLVAIALTRGPVELDPDTPEGTVQEYLLAISEQRWDDAIEVVHEDWRGSCEGSDLEAMHPGDFSAELGTEFGGEGEFIFEGGVAVAPGEPGAPATIPDDATQVEVTIHRSDDGGLGSSWSEYVVFELSNDGEFWWLVGDPWPHFTWACQAST
jgi:hypothetical protein